MAAIIGDLLRVGYTMPTAQYVAAMLDPDPERRPSASRCLVGLVKAGPLRYVPAAAVRQEAAVPPPAAQSQAPRPPAGGNGATNGRSHQGGRGAPHDGGPDGNRHLASSADRRIRAASEGPRPQDLAVPLLEDV